MSDFTEDFDNLLIRHDYLKRIPDLDKFSPYVIKYSTVAKNTSYRMYYKHKYNFEKVGIDLEDLEALSNIYILSYMGLYSIKYHPEKYEKVVNNYKKRKGSDPTEQFLENYEKNCLINFIRQRIKHACTLCERKSRNIIGSKGIQMTLAETKESIRADKEILQKNYQKYNYRKVPRKELEEIKKNSITRELYDKDGYRVIEIETYSRSMDSSECSNVFNYQDRNPEQLLIDAIDTAEQESNISDFHNTSDEEKIKRLKKFIRKNRQNPSLNKEKLLARKIVQNYKKYGILDYEV